MNAIIQENGDSHGELPKYSLFAVDKENNPVDLLIHHNKLTIIEDYVVSHNIIVINTLQLGYEIIIKY